MLCIGIFVKYTYALCTENKINFANQNKGKEESSYNFPTGQSEFSYGLTFWFISFENGGKESINFIESRNHSIL